MSTRNEGLDAHSAAAKAVSVIGAGYDLCKDIRLSACNFGPDGCRLIELDPNHTREVVFPGRVVVPDVPAAVKCHKGERLRIASEVLSFNQMSEQFNQEQSLSGKIPSGLFNTMFDMKNSLNKDASSTKSLAFDGWFITLYSVELDRSHTTLSEKVKREVPSSWNPAALAEFIEKYGTHIVVGVKMGGKDVVHIKQSKNSYLHPIEVQRLLTQLADERFSDDLSRSSDVNSAERFSDDLSRSSDVNSADLADELKNDKPMPWEAQLALAAAVRPNIRFHSSDEITSISVRKGGFIGIGQPFNQWLSTIPQSPNAISMSFVPITSLLDSVQGSGFLRHAVNLYLRYKPPKDELHQFLEFQLHWHWASVYDLHLGLGPNLRRNTTPSLKFSFMGPKLYVNTVQVDTGHRPVTGIRLFLEGRKSDRLAIHLRHLSNLPSILQISGDHDNEPIEEPVDPGYYEPVKWKMLSHVCTAPVQCSRAPNGESTSIVTKAWLEVKLRGMKKVLFLRLGYSTVASAKIRRSEWDGPSFSRKSGFFSGILISTRLSKELKTHEDSAKDDTSPAIFQADSGDAPVPTRAPKMLKFVDTKEMVRGPDDPPGYWVVTGARLCVEGGKITIRAKYSLLAIMSKDLLT